MPISPSTASTLTTACFSQLIAALVHCKAVRYASLYFGKTVEPTKIRGFQAEKPYEFRKQIGWQVHRYWLARRFIYDEEPILALPIENEFTLFININP